MLELIISFRIEYSRHFKYYNNILIFMKLLELKKSDRIYYPKFLEIHFIFTIISDDVN